jgi:mono/diheme cytochrome c family protein
MRNIIVNAMAAVSIVAPSVLTVPPASAQGKPRGEYLATIMDCGGCHTPGALAGEPDAARPLAGSNIGFQIPGVGIFYPPNLTPDAETGLGSWSEREIVTAVRTGVRPDGRVLAPICRTTIIRS